jgi:uncharacterized membrane protein
MSRWRWGRGVEHGEGRVEIDRIIFFSDAVIAIAITLLVLQLTDLVGPGRSGSEVTYAIHHLGPRLFSFVLSFVVIGQFWVGHHRIFRYVRRWDRRLLFVNLAFLMTITFLPFSTALLGTHLDAGAAVQWYALSVLIAGIASAGVWWYAAYGGKLVDSDRRMNRNLLARFVSTPAVFALSLTVIHIVVRLGAWHPSLAVLFWIALLPLVRIVVSAATAPDGE